jgi:hypothetical protein
MLRDARVACRQRDLLTVYNQSTVRLCARASGFELQVEEVRASRPDAAAVPALSFDLTGPAAVSGLRRSWLSIVQRGDCPGTATSTPTSASPMLGDEDESEMLVYEWTSSAQVTSSGAAGDFVLLFETVEGVQAEVFETLLVGVQLGLADVRATDLRAALIDAGCDVRTGPEWAVEELGAGTSQPDAQHADCSWPLTEESVCWRVSEADAYAAEPDVSEPVPSEGDGGGLR